MIRWANYDRRRARYIAGEVGHHQIQKGRFSIVFHWEKSRWENSQIESVPWSHRSLAEVPWLMSEVPTPSLLAWWQWKSPHMMKREWGWVIKSWSMLSEKDVDGVVTVWRTVQCTVKNVVRTEGRSQPEVVLGFGRCKSSTRRVVNGAAPIILKGSKQSSNSRETNNS